MKIVLDTETVQPPRDEWARLVGLPTAGDAVASVENTDDLFSRTEADEQRRNENELYERSAFDGTFSRIICIGVIAFSDEMKPQGALCWYGSNEKELLRQFWVRLAQDRPSLFITHNGLGFYMRFIRNRSIIHKIKPSI